MATATIEQHYTKRRLRLLAVIIDECDDEIEMGNDTGEDEDPAFGEIKARAEALIQTGDTLLTAEESRDTDRRRGEFDIAVGELLVQVRDAQRVGYFDLFGE
ncbi:MAG: hypothetical protein ABF876_14500 [Acetobacter aceti]